MLSAPVSALPVSAAAVAAAVSPDPVWLVTTPVWLATTPVWLATARLEWLGTVQLVWAVTALAAVRRTAVPVLVTWASPESCPFAARQPSLDRFQSSAPSSSQAPCALPEPSL